MKTLWDELNAKSNEMAKQVSRDEMRSGETARERKQEVEKTGFWKKSLKGVRKIVPFTPIVFKIRNFLWSITMKKCLLQFGRNILS